MYVNNEKCVGAYRRSNCIFYLSFNKQPHLKLLLDVSVFVTENLHN